MVTASVVKLDTLETLLLQHQNAGTALSDNEQDLATDMIEHSDNERRRRRCGPTSAATRP